MSACKALAAAFRLKRAPRLRAGLSIALTLVLLLAAACRGELPADVARRSAITIEELRPDAGALALPNKPGSVKFAVIGDSGRGDRMQQEVADQMVKWRARFSFDFVLMLGDNIYDTHTPDDYRRKFEVPYGALLDAGVEFRAAIGNHDDPKQIYYEKFNMGGERYYSFHKTEKTLRAVTGAGVHFFALDSRTFDRGQLDWLHGHLKSSPLRWKIVFFHHPLYTSGRYQSASYALRRALEPILVDGDTDVVLAGHEHFYERMHPQHGILYFVSGAAGSLRPNDIRPTELTARGFDTDYSFMLMEAAGDELYFQSVSRTGATVDAGVIRKGEGREH